MRSGITTGTCAAAAAKAAALVLRAHTVGDGAAGTGSTPAPESVHITLPDGEAVRVPVHDISLVDATVAWARVIKDAGDDVDVTDGATVEVTVELGGKGVRFAAGEGVGTVTRPGLQLAVGEPAINPVPRQMIEQALSEVFDGPASALVTVGVVGGGELAERTFNPRLGIEGGISIIGTTGRVEPKSTEAWMRSLVPQVDMALEAGHVKLWLAPGGIGEQYAIDELGADPRAVVQCSNFVGDLLDACAERGVEAVVLVGHAGKLVKVAAGLFNTHSSVGDARLETVAAVAAAEGAPGSLVARLLDLTTVQSAVELLHEAGLDRTWNALAVRAARRASQRARLQVETVLLGYEGRLLGASSGACQGGSADGRSRSEDDGRGSLFVVGIGPGARELVTPAAWRAVREADLVVGGARLLSALAPFHGESLPLTSDISAALGRVRSEVAAGRRVVVVSSGDPSFFGILAAVRRELPDVEYSVVPGISSAQLALSRLNEAWEGVVVTSAHGRDPGNALETCVANARVLVLVDRSTPPQSFAALLDQRGRFEVNVCERLGYPDERITTDSAERIAAGVFDPLSVLFVRSIEERGTS